MRKLLILVLLLPVLACGQNRAFNLIWAEELKALPVSGDGNDTLNMVYSPESKLAVNDTVLYEWVGSKLDSSSFGGGGISTISEIANGFEFNNSGTFFNPQIEFPSNSKIYEDGSVLNVLSNSGNVVVRSLASNVELQPSGSGRVIANSTHTSNIAGPNDVITKGYADANYLGGSTPGIDDVLAENQTVPSDRSITSLTGNRISLNSLVIPSGTATMFIEGNGVPTFETEVANGAGGDVSDLVIQPEIGLMRSSGPSTESAVRVDATNGNGSELKFNTGATLSSLGIRSTDITLTDQHNTKGMVYAANYDANGVLDDNWIPSYRAVKAYADGVGGSIPNDQLVYQTSNADYEILSNTSDGSDNKGLILASGGAISTFRGAFIQLGGNERAGFEGNISFRQGNVAGAQTIFTVGAGTNAVILEDDGGLVVGAASGGSQGLGTLNAVSVYDDGSLLTDYVFEKEFRGWVTDEYGRGFSRKSLEEEVRHVKENYSLSTLPTRKQWESQRPSVGELQQDLYETIEVQFLYIMELHNRLEKLEKR